MPLIVEVTRAGLVETLHPIVAAVADARGVRWSQGGDFRCFWRSSSKPMQLLTSLEQIPADIVADLSDDDLAIGAASHGATPAHVAVVTSLLVRFGLSAEGLRCGAHWPSDTATARALSRDGGEPSALHNNCSGKHTFMLAAAAARGWAPDYRPADHPLQRLNRDRMADWCEDTPGIAVDGCGVPTFHVSVDAMARAFARLAGEMRRDGLARRIGHAMARRPDLVSSPGEIDVTLVQAAGEPLVAKRGAEGLVCVALPERGLGIAVKNTTGDSTALAVGLRAVLDEVAPGLAGEWRKGVDVRNVVGAVVGERRARWV